MVKFLEATLILALSLCITAMLYICLIFCVVYSSYRDMDAVRVQTVSDNLAKTDGYYTLDEKIQNQLIKNGCFAMLINPEGYVIWALNMPEDVPYEYTLKDVAAFSKWYLNDYPTFVWEHTDGLIVLCMPKNTIWKYNFVLPESEVATIMFVLMPIWLVSLMTIYCLQMMFNRAARNKRDAARTEWIAGVSHDLRTPLTTIMGYSDALCKEELSESARGEAQAICEQSEKIAALMESFNLFNRLQFGEKAIKKLPCKPAAIIRKVVADILNNTSSELYQIEVNLTPVENVVIHADEDLLSRALQNLIRNSIIHNPQGCRVEIKAEQSVRYIVITVSDNGKGFPQQIYRSGFKKSDYLNLHGFGLTIVHRIVLAHKGKVKFYNQRGAVSRLTFRR